MSYKSNDPDVRWDEGYKAGLRVVQRNAEKERRERIATSALQGILSNSEILIQNGLTAKKVAHDAVEFADALIEALDAEPGKGGTK